MVDDLSGAGAPPLAAIPADIRTLADYERRARAHLPTATWAHIQDGADACDDRAAFARWRLLPRALGDLAGGSTAIDLLGEPHAAPILLAPVAYQRLAHPGGELAVVRAATVLETGMIVSTLASHSLEAIAQARREAAAELGTAGAGLWFQLYLQPQREDSLALIHRAERAGYRAIVLTIDAGVKRSSFALPGDVTAVNLAGMARAAHVAVPGGRILFGTPLADAVPSWQDLTWLRAATRLPLLVKGMMTGADAARMVELGSDGLILSNHGGRVLDALPAVIDVLPQVCAAVKGRVPVLIDGGVRSGADVVKALCLGASAVAIGRPLLHALAVAGMPGVAHALHLLRAELESVMAQLGCGRVADLDQERLLRV